MFIKLFAGGEIMTDSNDINQVVQEILADMPLKEKAAIANLDEDKVPYLQYAFDVCVSDQLGKDDEMSKDVMHRIWEVLQETHRVRCLTVALIFSFLLAISLEYPENVNSEIMCFSISSICWKRTTFRPIFLITSFLAFFSFNSDSIIPKFLN